MSWLEKFCWFLTGFAIAILLSGCFYPKYRIIPQWFHYPPEKEQPDYYVAYPMNKEHKVK